MHSPSLLVGRPHFLELDTISQLIVPRLARSEWVILNMTLLKTQLSRGGKIQSIHEIKLEMAGSPTSHYAEPETHLACL